jgi:predicted dehydrogenase
MLEPTNIALIGIGGYGNVYVSALLDKLPGLGGRELRLVGAADPNPASCNHLAELRALGIPIYSSPETLLATTKPDLVVISSPIQYHREHILLALSHEAHVLCEKPLCATVEQARDLLAAVRKSRRHVAVGYQWSFGQATQRLKSDILEGVLGRPKRLRTLVLWPRGEKYYARNSWAGRLSDSQGRPVFDSPVNNACAHFLHNMLYVLGPTMDSSAVPSRVSAELYRAKPIESFDTAALRCTMQSGGELMFVVSHATRSEAGPRFEYEFEEATVSYDERQTARFIARFRDGRILDYGAPPAAGEAGKLLDTVASIRADHSGPCGVEAAIPQVAVTAAAHLSGRDIIDIPASAIVSEGGNGERRTWVNGLDALLERCYRESRMPSELPVAWALPGTEVAIGDDLTLYTRRPVSKPAGAAV